MRCVFDTRKLNYTLDSKLEIYGYGKTGDDLLKG